LPKPPQSLKVKSPNQTAAIDRQSAIHEEWEILTEEKPSDDRNEVFKHLEADLRNQIKISSANAQYFTNIGDVQNTNRYGNPKPCSQCCFSI
jgi:hypothetical protein